MKWGFPFSFNFLFWGTVGVLRSSHERLTANHGVARGGGDNGEDAGGDRVAVCIAARNEDQVLQATLDSVARIVAPEHTFVVSDGSTDRTDFIPLLNGCRLLTYPKAKGKARALEALFAAFDILERFDFVLFLDADTIVDERYIANALRVFEDPEVACVAGYARTRWDSYRGLRWSSFAVAYRMRLYRLLQLFLCYGQTWKYLNVLPVVPGFASMYRTSVLKRLSIFVPGIAIEDFGLAFQIHRQRLGVIAHSPAIFATCQDPHTLDDYYKQVRRWTVGYFQTVKHFGMWPSLFWASILLFMIEVSISALFFVMFPLLLLFLALSVASPPFGGWISSMAPAILDYQMVWDIAVGIFLVDYLFTIFVAIKDRKPSLLIYGLGFIYFRILDSLIYLTAGPVGLATKSNGMWASPRRC
jgi:biofilm PGA synthesis N-glycosyltransferase PgaC